MEATVSVFDSNETEAKVSPVRVKFQLNDALRPLKSCMLSAVLGTVLSVSVLTGGGSCQVILPPSEIQNYRHSPSLEIKAFLQKDNRLL